MKETFSYLEYIGIINEIRKYLPIMDYSEIDETTPRYCVIRHDVEFSVEQAYNLAKLEVEELGTNTSYFIQLRNDSYNPFSQKSASLIKKIHEMGHKIGLHVYFENSQVDDFRELILRDIKIMENCFNVPIDRFSYHRPPPEILEKNLRIDGLINPYDKKFFSYFKGEKPDYLDVLYISESNKMLDKRWPYGYPLDFLDGGAKKMQILTHPYQWTKGGYKKNLDAFLWLLEQKRNQLIEIMKRDCKNFEKLWEIYGKDEKKDL